MTRLEQILKTCLGNGTITINEMIALYGAVHTITILPAELWEQFGTEYGTVSHETIKELTTPQ